jgi:hypothetical protein
MAMHDEVQWADAGAMSNTCRAPSAPPSSSGSGGTRCAAILEIIDTCLAAYEVACIRMAAGRVGRHVPRPEARP